MTEKKHPDTTAALLAAAAAWITEAVSRASPQGRTLAAQAMARPASDLTVVLTLKKGTAQIFACGPGHEPVWIAEASLTPLTPADVATVAGSDAIN